MATPIKLTVIGAGSAQFSLGLVKDICLTPGLAGSLITFMDIDEARLEMIHQLARRYASELGADLRFASTRDRRAALHEADFVINTASAHGHHQQRAERELSAKHGYYYGGVNLGNFANLELMLSVARDMEATCPDAWLIQSGNPVYEGCNLMTRNTGIKICGLCHGHYGVYRMAEILGLDVSDLHNFTWQAPGLNHNIWLTHFYYKGENAYPLLDQWIVEQGEEFWRTHVAQSTHDIQMSRGSIHMYHLFGKLPIGDTPRRGGWWYHSDLATKRHWFGEPYGGPDTELARPFFVANLEKRITEMTQLANDPKASMVATLGAKKTREQQVPIIDALVNNNEGYFQVNVPNHGALQGVPDNVVVEIPALINKMGIHRLHVDPLPAKILYEQILPEWLDMERELLAFQTGDRSMLLWNTLMSPQTRNYEQGVAVMEDLLAMPGHEAMNAHYQYAAEMLSRTVGQ